MKAFACENVIVPPAIFEEKAGERQGNHVSMNSLLTMRSSAWLDTCRAKRYMYVDIQFAGGASWSDPLIERKCGSIVQSWVSLDAIREVISLCRGEISFLRFPYYVYHFRNHLFVLMGTSKGMQLF